MSQGSKPKQSKPHNESTNPRPPRNQSTDHGKRASYSLRKKEKKRTRPCKSCNGDHWDNDCPDIQQYRQNRGLNPNAPDFQQGQWQGQGQGRGQSHTWTEGDRTDIP